MPIYEYTCPDGHEFEELRKVDDREECPCPVCDQTAKQVIRTPPRPNWAALAMGDSASPEAIRRFDRIHREQKAKEERIFREHGSL